MISPWSQVYLSLVITMCMISPSSAAGVDLLDDVKSDCASAIQQTAQALESSAKDIQLDTLKIPFEDEMKSAGAYGKQIIAVKIKMLTSLYDNRSSGSKQDASDTAYAICVEAMLKIEETFLPQQKATDLIERGRKLLLSERIPDAIPVLSRAIRLDPNNAKGYTWRGRAFARSGKWYSAIRDLSKGIELDPKDITAHADRGAACVSAGKYALAIKDLSKVIERDPKNGRAFRDRGIAFSRSGKYESAIKDLNQAMQMGPGPAITYHERGVAFSRSGRYESAIKDFTRAAELDPGRAATYHERGMALLRSRKPESAVRDFSKAIELNPRAAASYFWRGSAYAGTGTCEPAFADVDKALELDPLADYTESRQQATKIEACADKLVREKPEPMNYYHRGTVHLIMHEYAKAMDDLNSAIRLAPDSYRLYHRRGQSYAGSGQYQQAIDDYTKAAELNPTLPSLYSDRADAYKSIPSIAENHALALFDHNKAVGLGPTDPLPLYRRAKFYYENDYMRQAITDLTNAVTLDPGFQRGYGLRGLVLGSRKQFEDALEDLSLAISLDPGSPENYFHRAIAYQRLGKREDALADHIQAAVLGYKPAQDVLRSLNIRW